MGRRRRKQSSQQKSENKWNENAPRRHYEGIKLENADFEKYYKIQKLIPEEEWESFISCMKRPLPTSFRITASKSEARALLNIIKGTFFKDILLNPITDKNDEMGDEEKIKPQCLTWYPDELAWQLQLTRKDIRRSEAYFRLHNFLICETNCGNISRQEAVSMIPPLVLDVESHHRILDLCAAPGSKTAQLIEYLHRDDKVKGLPSGLVIANDVDNSRCYMLVHQAKRLSSPCVIVTNHDAAIMPNLITSTTDNKHLRFDRVLCDVPCSGDGTLRKHADIWTKWNSANGNNLHGIQFRIAKRGLELLTIGGRLVYSTCSLNPIENEAVIHRILCEAKGAVKLVPIEDKLPGLKYIKGVSNWRVTSRDLQSYDSIDEVPEKYQTSVRPPMFPPKPEDTGKLNLDLCIRVFPHHQNTGGFFIAALEKIDSLPWEASNRTNRESNSTETRPEEPKEPSRKKRRIQGYKEDPFVFFTENEQVWPSIKEFYGLVDTFEYSCLLTRCHEGKKKNIYFTSPTVRDLIVANQGKVKFINSGIKTFARADNKEPQPGACSFRLAQEGVSEIYKYISPKRIVTICKYDLILLMSCEDPTKPPEFTNLDENTRKQLELISPGSCVLLFREEASESNPDPLSIEIVGWRGQRSLRAYTPLSDAIHYLRLCGVDVTKYDVNKFKNKDASENENSEEKLNNSPPIQEMETNDEDTQDTKEN